MSGVLRLSNNVTGRSTINASASNDQTYTLPALGGTLVTGGASSELIFPPGTEALPGLHVQGDVDTGLYAPAANTLGISTGGNERLRIDSSGRVGIGTTTPGKKLVVNHGAGDGLMLIAPNTAESTLYFGDTDDDDVGRIIYDHSINAMKFRVAASEAVRIDSSGRLLVGTSTGVDSSSGVNSQFQVHSATGPAMFGRFANDATASALYLIKSRNTTTGGQTIVNNNDNIGRIAFEASDGAQLRRAAIIDAYVDGTPGTNDMPGRLVFSTTADGLSSPTERMRIDSSGRLGIGTNIVRGALGLQHGNTSPQGLTDVAIDALRINQSVGGIIAIRATQYDSINQPAAGDTQFFNLFYDGSNYTWFERMRITAEGRVGIGTTSPSQKLTTVGNIKIAGAQAGNISNLILTRTDRSWSINNETDLRFYTDGGDTDSPATTTVVFTGGGRVGIGTSAPGAPLAFEDSTALKIQLNGGATNYYGISKLTGGGNLGDGEFRFTSGNVSGGAFTFKSGPSERMRIDSSGRLLVGTSSADAGSTDTATIIGAAQIKSTGLISLSAGGTLDLNLLGTGIVGHLYVSSTLTSNAVVRTSSIYFIATRQGNSTAITLLNSDSGSSGGRTFTITNPSANIFRFTDTSGSNCHVSMSFVGGISF